MTVTGQEVILRPIVALWFTALVVLPVVSVLPPEWVTGSAYSVRVFENATVGTTLSTISAKSDPSNTNKSVTFLLPDLSAKLVNLSDAYNSAPDIWSAQVILAAQLDSDYEPSVRYLYFEAQDEVGTKSSTSLTLNILDVNDNPPSFQRLPYDVSVPEFPDELSETFMTEGVFFAINISLKAPLDFETRSFYSFPVVAQDPEGLNATANVRVTVTDVQDTPPFFLLDSYRAAVLENQAVGTSIIKVSAEDGDRNPQNDIRYSIVRGNTDFFAVDSVTGVITSLVVLDRDNETMVGKDGFFDLVVQANETDDVQPQLGNTTREAAVVVVVLDDNDNPPTFKSSAPYTAFLREDVANDTLVYFEGEGYIFVSDADQGQNSHFNLTVERGGVPWPALVPTPSDVVQEALVLLRVRNSADIREEAGKHINIQLVAREVSTSQRFSSTANIIIAVEANPEVTTTPAPSSGYDVTAPDIVVFVIGFLVVFNIVTTVLIICFMRRGGRPPREGQAKGGAKYYVSDSGEGGGGAAIHKGSLERNVGSDKDAKRQSLLKAYDEVSKMEPARVETRDHPAGDDGKTTCPVVLTATANTSQDASPKNNILAVSTATDQSHDPTKDTTSTPVTFINPSAATSTSGPDESGVEPVTRFSANGRVSTVMKPNSPDGCVWGKGWWRAGGDSENDE
ncbi:hypothetical protein C0Q70_01866 [Pomacea canaliculata]|uniref:Cadherin domain-containing protein n=1 Tax=Pomacea canaliculata TaxID=400727 RepID=A0A2T7Q0Q4_POMCA|nr:hypothetical protein C0Q70_01866 [Pomacea canaliculata]